MRVVTCRYVVMTSIWTFVYLIIKIDCVPSVDWLEWSFTRRQIVRIAQNKGSTLIVIECSWKWNNTNMETQKTSVHEKHPQQSDCYLSCRNALTFLNCIYSLVVAFAITKCFLSKRCCDVMNCELSIRQMCHVTSNNLWSLNPTHPLASIRIQHRVW